MEKVFDFIDKSGAQYVKELQVLLGQPSISVHNDGIEETVAIVKKLLQDISPNVEVIVPGKKSAPILCAEISGETKKTILFYNHYDVRPPATIDEWKYQPFGGTIDGGKIYASGAADNKGDLMARIKAIEALIKIKETLPLTVKFIIEGEAESGSPTLADVVSLRPELLHADLCISATGSSDDEGRLELTIMNNQCPDCPNRKADIISAVAEAVTEFHQRSPVVLSSSAKSSPMLEAVSKLGIPVIGLGIANRGSRVHGSDENINTADFLDGIKLIAFIMQKLSGSDET